MDVLRQLIGSRITKVEIEATTRVHLNAIIEQFTLPDIYMVRAHRISHRFPFFQLPKRLNNVGHNRMI